MCTTRKAPKPGLNGVCLARHYRCGLHRLIYRRKQEIKLLAEVVHLVDVGRLRVPPAVSVCSLVELQRRAHQWHLKCKIWQRVFVVKVDQSPGETSGFELSLLPRVHVDTLLVVALVSELAFDPHTGQNESLEHATPQLMGARLSKLAATCARQPVVVGLVCMLDDDLLSAEESLSILCFPAGIH
jgi:hypothetical protein